MINQNAGLLTVTLSSFILEKSLEFTYRHSLLFSSTEHVHPVLNTVPASFALKDMTQLHVIQVLFQYLSGNEDKIKHTVNQYSLSCFIFYTKISLFPLSMPFKKVLFKKECGITVALNFPVPVCINLGKICLVL